MHRRTAGPCLAVPLGTSSKYDWHLRGSGRDDRLLNRQRLPTLSLVTQDHLNVAMEFCLVTLDLLSTGKHRRGLKDHACLAASRRRNANGLSREHGITSRDHECRISRVGCDIQSCIRDSRKHQQFG